jgi:hypothetical protein
VENVAAFVFSFLRLRLRFVCVMCDPLIAQSLRHLFKIDKTEERFLLKTTRHCSIKACGSRMVAEY